MRDLHARAARALALLAVSGRAAVGSAVLHRGDLHIRPGFVNVSELTFLRHQMVEERVLSLRSSRNFYARQKKLLDMKTLAHEPLPLYSALRRIF